MSAIEGKLWREELSCKVCRYDNFEEVQRLVELILQILLTVEVPAIIYKFSLGHFPFPFENRFPCAVYQIMTWTQKYIWSLPSIAERINPVTVRTLATWQSLVLEMHSVNTALPYNREETEASYSAAHFPPLWLKTDSWLINQKVGP